MGRDYGKTKNFSDKVAHEIDEEVRKIVEECYSKAQKILRDNEKLVHLLADTLVEHETLTKEQIDSLVKTGKLIPEDEIADDETLVELRSQAKEKGIKGYTKMTKEELEEALNDK